MTRAWTRSCAACCVRKGLIFLMLCSANLQDRAVFAMCSLKISWSSKITPRFVTEIDGVIVEEPSWMVKSCCSVEVAGKTRSSVFARLSCKWWDTPKFIYIFANNFTPNWFLNEGQFKAGFVKKFKLEDRSVPIVRDPAAPPEGVSLTLYIFYDYLQIAFAPLWKIEADEQSSLAFKWQCPLLSRCEQSKGKRVLFYTTTEEF